MATESDYETGFTDSDTDSNHGSDDLDMYDTQSDEEDLTRASHAKDFDIDHKSGDFKMTAEKLETRINQPGFTSRHALDMFQARYTMDYGRHDVGVGTPNLDDDYFLAFHLDMIAIVGKPMCPISDEGEVFDNVTFSFQNWHAPYTSKHVIGRLPFDLRNRTFRIATGSARELWYIVMHPNQPGPVEFEHSRSRRRHKQTQSGRGSALQRHHAEALASYIKSCFDQDELQGEGVELSWRLNDKRSQTLEYSRWSLFQEKFMEGWGAWVEDNKFDDFWVDNKPAFHTYDHGSNVEIQAGPEILGLPQETCIRDQSESESSESESGDSDDGGGHEEWAGFRDDSQGGNNIEEIRDSQGEDGFEEGDSQEDDSTGDSEPQEGDEPQPGDDTDNDPELLFTGGIETLRQKLQARYHIHNIEEISYALAANINCSTRGQDGQTRCLLADRSRILEEYDNKPFTFYPLAFNPKYGNFSSPQPPKFLKRICDILRFNMAHRNLGGEFASFGFFQAYSNIKRAIRSRPADLLATQGIATAALTMPPSEVAQSARLKSRHESLLDALHGRRTPENPESSIPFAREGQQIDIAIRENQVSFRMEQVVHIKTSSILGPYRSFVTVLQPIFQLMSFFAQKKESYLPLLRSFRPAVFPGVLCSFAALFDQAISYLDGSREDLGSKGLNIALSEAVAALDRLGSYCFTGDPRVLSTNVMKPLHTLDSLRRGGWPYISPDVLDFRSTCESGYMRMSRWPRAEDGKPILLHIKALEFHYGATTAANRLGQIWFSEMGDKTVQDIKSAIELSEEIIKDLWMPQTVAFIARWLRRRINRGSRSRPRPTGEETIRQLESVSKALKAWEESEDPFSSNQYNKLFEPDTMALIEHNGPDPTRPAPLQQSPKTRYDWAKELYRACKSTKKSSGQAFSAAGMTWLAILQGAIQNIDQEHVSEDDWVGALTTAIARAGVEWAPASHKGRLTVQYVNILTGPVANMIVLSARAGSLKRDALEAEFEMDAGVGAKHRRRRAAIDFRQSIPFTTVPTIVSDGFARLAAINPDKRVVNHYEVAHSCLIENLSDPLVTLMLIQVLTFAACSETPYIENGTSVIRVAPKKKRREPRLLAANLVTRMLWYLYRDVFPWEEDRRGVMAIKLMTQKVEHKGVPNRMLQEMGWIVASSKRPNPQNTESSLAPRQDLLEDLEELLVLMRKDAKAFILRVFHTTDTAWVERCASIVRQRGVAEPAVSDSYLALYSSQRGS